MIPQEKSAAVTRGLREAFGVTEFEDIHAITGGQTSALVFRIIVRGSPFLLRIIMRTDDPTCHFTCMKSAAEAGLAPHVWYTSVEDRLAITDFVPAVPLSGADALVRMPRTLRALHALPPFPARAPHLNTTCTFLLNKSAAQEGFIRSFQAANLLPKNETDELLALFAQLASAYPLHDPDMVSSHNDLFKPDNILFDGDRVWLVDWEAAFLNDRYADLAVVANMVVNNDAEEKIYLQEYFGKPPEEYQSARFYLMKQIAHIFYAMGFLWIGSAGKQVKLSGQAPEFSDFYQRFWTGDIKLDDSETKIAFARVHLEQVLQNSQKPPFNEALRIVSDRLAYS